MLLCIRTVVKMENSMNSESVFVASLRFLGVFFIGAGLMHVTLGVQADQMLGAKVSAQSLADPGLDSQNRFYGASFTLYGVLLIICSSQLQQYATILRCMFWVVFAAGLVRFISVFLYGWPPMLIGLLFAAELILPPPLHVWLSRILREMGSETVSSHATQARVRNT